MKTIEGLFARKEKNILRLNSTDEYSHFVYRFYHTGFVLGACISAQENLNYQHILKWLTMENLSTIQFGKYVIKKNSIRMKIYWYLSDDFSLTQAKYRGYIEDETLIIRYRPSIFESRQDSTYYKVNL